MVLKTMLPALVFAAIAIGAGIAYGIYSERWTDAVGVDDAVKLLGSIPATIGDWQAAPLQLDDSDLRKVGIKGHYFSAYRNANKGTSVTVLLVCGRPGPISVHTPDICYAAAGYQADGAPRLQTVELGHGVAQRMWSARFHKPNSPNDPDLEIFWAWKADDSWSAPENPRFAFANKHALYKLYVIRYIAPHEKGPADESYKDFLKSLLPTLNKALSSSG
jgi:hypothetical protein